MKNTRVSLHIILVIAMFSISNAQIIEGDVNLTTQAEVNLFSGTSISGNLLIQGSGILSLLPLLVLETVGGDLVIGNCVSLSNLDGLTNLTSVSGELSIHHNGTLTTLDGLTNLTSIGETLWLQGNAALTNLDGLDNLTSLEGNLTIENNGSLININGLSELTSVSGDLWLENNGALINLGGLYNLAHLGGYLWVEGNAALTDLDGLLNLINLDGYLKIATNASLSSFCGLYLLLNSAGLDGSYSVYDNLVNPTQQQVLDAGPCATTEIAENRVFPGNYNLQQNYPNPFNPATTISYALPEQSTVRLTVHDVRGQEVTALQDEVKAPGIYEMQWSGVGQYGNPVSTGVYFGKLQAGDYSKTIKMVYLRYFSSAQSGIHSGYH